MSLDRQRIEKRDFPIGRRGYEPEAVDEHLARLAAEFDAFHRQSQRRSSSNSLPAVASQQVAAIVQAAETTAADLERQANEEAARIQREAEAEARNTREEAIETSQAHVGRVSDSVAHMLQRVDAMESELSALLESLRTGANRLQADLTLLEGNMGELHDQGRGGRGERTEAVAEGARRREVPAPPAPREQPRAVVAEPEPVDEVPVEKEPTVPEPEPEPIAAAEPEPEPEP